MITDIRAKNAIFLGEKQAEDEQRPFKARFLQAGLVKYDFGVCLLKKETIDKFINTFIDCPVIIDHKDNLTEEDRKGTIKNIWFSPEDGWFWCDGFLSDEAADLVENGYNVSCQYRITEYANNFEHKLHNGNEYDKEILNGIFEHLAIVENPRYEDAYIAVNAIDVNDENIEEWITVKGNHIPVYKGQTKDEAIQEFIDSAKGYSETGKQSNRAIAATLRGLGTKSELAKELGIKQKELTEDILFSSEWHHHGKQYKKENYYYIEAYKDLQKNGDISKETIEKYDLSDDEIKGIKDSWKLIDKKLNSNKPETLLKPYLEQYKNDEFLKEKLEEVLSKKKNVSAVADTIRQSLNWLRNGEITDEKFANIIKFYSKEEIEKRRAQKAKNEALEKAGYIHHIEPAYSPDIRSENATRYQDVLLHTNNVSRNEKKNNHTASNSFYDDFTDYVYNTLSEGLNDCLGELIAINEKWISKKDKNGKVYHINIDEEENPNKEEIKKLKEERKQIKKSLDDLKYEQTDLSGAYANRRHKNTYSKVLVDQVGYDIETKNRKFNRIIQDIKNMLNVNLTELDVTKLEELQNKLEDTFFSYYDDYSDGEEKAIKFWEAVNKIQKYININKQIKELQK